MLNDPVTLTYEMWNNKDYINWNKPENGPFLTFPIFVQIISSAPTEWIDRFKTNIFQNKNKKNLPWKFNKRNYNVIVDKKKSFLHVSLTAWPDLENVRWYKCDRNKDAQTLCKDAAICSAVISNAADSEKTTAGTLHMLSED